MATVIWRHCDGIKLLYNVTLQNQANKGHIWNNDVYRNNMIPQEITSDVISDPNEWSHFSTRRKQIKNKNNNKSSRRWYVTIALEWNS